MDCKSAITISVTSPLDRLRTRVRETIVSIVTSSAVEMCLRFLFSTALELTSVFQSIRVRGTSVSRSESISCSRYKNSKRQNFLLELTNTIYQSLRVRGTSVSRSESVSCSRHKNSKRQNFLLELTNTDNTYYS